MPEEDHVFEEIGEAGFTRLVAAFYRQIPGDDILGPMYPADDLAGAEQRLREFLIFRFGGPATYIENRGHPRLRMRHNPFPITAAARARWMELMGRALDEAGVSGAAERTLRGFFETTSEFLVNRDR